eukprot:Polyplicarium_translucidae@DN1157_c0_g1_i2.p1
MMEDPTRNPSPLFVDWPAPPVEFEAADEAKTKCVLREMRPEEYLRVREELMPKVSRCNRVHSDVEVHRLLEMRIMYGPVHVKLFCNAVLNCTPAFQFAVSP